MAVIGALFLMAAAIILWRFHRRARGGPDRHHLKRPACLGILSVIALSMIATGGMPGVKAGQARAGNDDPGGFLNIMPPGQDGSANAAEWTQYTLTKQYPAHFNDQTGMYKALAYREKITEEELTKYFKRASFALEGKAERTYSPVKGASIRRDGFGVPHIRGQDRDATLFAVGYATAEDRLFLMDVLRHLGRGRMSEFLGASSANREMDRAQVAAAPYREEELTQQVENLCAHGAEGARVCRDAKAYTRGVNAYIRKARLDPRLLPAEYPALQLLPKQWKPEDSVAVASLVGGIFGKGGGGEVASGRFLTQLRERYGQEEGRKIWEGFRSAEDREAPVTVNKSFPYNLHQKIDPASTALLDPESADQALKAMKKPKMVADDPLGPIDLRTPEQMSNAILVDGKHTKAGKPIAVFGPQTGYFSPQLLVETNVHGPGIDARGVAFAGTNLYVQLGRGKNYAWSATSASADNVDQWVVRLCEPDGGEPTMKSTGYLYKGECRPMDSYTHRQIAKPTAAGVPDGSKDSIIFDIPVERTVYGPVNARGTADGKPVAVTAQRSTYGKELDSAIGFARVNDPEYMVKGSRSFLKAFDGVDYTFNWFYADEQDIAYKHSCLCPVRDPRTDPDLPAWGTGEYDWTGKFLKPGEQPQAINPEQGYFANWNNKQAPGFRANDANYDYGPVHRSLLLVRRMKEAVSGRKLDRADMVSIMNDAATVDLKGQEVYPWVLKVLGEQAPGGDPVLQDMRDRLAEWVQDGGHRRDLAPRDGTYDHAVAVAIGDAAFETLTEAMFDPHLRGADLPNPLEDSPRKGEGSAFIGGWYSFVQKDLRQVLGEPVKDPRPRTACGDGSRSACREALWQAMDRAAERLAAEYGSRNVDDWIYDGSRDAIKQKAVGLLAAPDMPWINRPTFQQVVQVGQH